MIRLLSILVLVLTLNSCGVSYRINSYDTNTINEDLYNVEVIETSNQLRWKLQTDWDFANNYYWFLQRQNYSFFHNQYYRNRLYRYGWYSPHDYWMNWSWNYHSRYNNYNWNGWNNYYGWNYWNGYHYSSWRYYNNHPYYRRVYSRRYNNLGNVFDRNNRIRVYNNTSRRVPRSTQNNNRVIRNVTPRINPTIKPRTNPTIKPRVRPTIKPRVRPNTKPNVRPTTRPTTTTRSSNRGVPRYSKKRNN